MPENIKKYLGISLIVGVLGITYAAYRYAGAYAESIEPSSFRSFSAGGVGKAVGVPDIARFTFSVITEGGKNLADLQKENTEKINKTIAFVKSKGVDAKDIKTANYNISPRYKYYSCTAPLDGETRACPPPEIVGYSLNQSVQVKIRDFAKAGEVLAGVVQNGANSASELSFEMDDPTSVQDEAREEAIKKAQEKAKMIAKAGGFSIGRLLSIEESGGIPPILYRKELAYGMGGDAAVATPAPSIEPGSEDVTVTVYLRYEIR